jgi:hypothetical protein
VRWASTLGKTIIIEETNSSVSKATKLVFEFNNSNARDLFIYFYF